MQAKTMQETRPNILQQLADNRTGKKPLQFIIWISSLRYPLVTLEEDIPSVYERIVGQERALQSKFGQYKQRLPSFPTHSGQCGALGHCSEDHVVGEHYRVNHPSRLSSRSEHLLIAIISQMANRRSRNLG